MTATSRAAWMSFRGRPPKLRKCRGARELLRDYVPAWLGDGDKPAADCFHLYRLESFRDQRRASANEHRIMLRAAEEVAGHDQEFRQATRQNLCGDAQCHGRQYGTV